MTLFRKKPVIIEASQWFKNGDHPEDYRDPEFGFYRGEPGQISPEYRRDHNWEGQVVLKARQRSRAMGISVLGRESGLEKFWLK